MPEIPSGYTELQPGQRVGEGQTSVIIDGKYYVSPPSEQPPSEKPVTSTTPIVTKPPTVEEEPISVAKIPPPPVALTPIAQLDYQAQYAKEHGLPQPELSNEQLRQYQEARGYTAPGSGVLMPFVPGYETAPESQKIPGIATKEEWQNLGTPTGKELLSISQSKAQIQPSVVPISGLDTSIPTLRIGLQTDNPIEIRQTPEILSLKGSSKPINALDPNGMTEGQLYNVLINEGLENYQRAINASNFIVQQEQKRQGILQTRFESLYTKLPYKDEQGNDQWVANTLITELKKAQDPQSKEVYRLLTTVGLKEAQDYAKQVNDRYQAQQNAMNTLNKGGFEFIREVPRPDLPREFDYYTYLVFNKNNPGAIKNIHTLVEDNDTRIRLIQTAQVVVDTQKRLQVGGDVPGLANAMEQNSINTSFLNQQQIIDKYNQLPDYEKMKVAESYINDPNNKNIFAQAIEAFNLELAKQPTAARLLNIPAGYVSTVLTPIAKGLTNQPLIAQDWQSMGLNIALLSIPVVGGLGTFGQVAAKGIGLGAGAIMTGVTIKDAVDQIQGVKPFDPIGLTISTAFDALILGGAAKSSIDKASKQPLTTQESWAKGGMWDDALGKHEVGDTSSVKVNVSAITEATKPEVAKPSVPTATRIGEAISDIKTTFTDIPDKVNKTLDNANRLSDSIKQEVLTGEKTAQLAQNTVKGIKEVADAARFVLEQSVKEGIRAIDEANTQVINRMTKSVDDALFNIKPEIPSENLKPILIDAVNKITDGMIELKIPEGQILKEGQVPQRINYEIQDNARIAINEALGKLRDLLTKEGVDIKQTQIEADIIQLLKDIRYQMGQIVPNIGRGLNYTLDMLDSGIQVLADTINKITDYNKAIDSLKSYSKTLADKWSEQSPDDLQRAIEVKYGSLITDPNRIFIESIPKDIANSISKIVRFFADNEALDIEKVNPKDISNIMDDISQAKFNLKLLGFNLESTLYKMLDTIDRALQKITVEILEGRTLTKPIEYINGKLSEINEAIKARDFATAIEKTNDIDTTIIQRYQAEQNGKVLSGLLTDIANAVKSKDNYTLADRANQLERFADDVAKRNPSQTKAMGILRQRAIDLQKNPGSYTEYFDKLSPEDKVVVLEGLKNTEQIVNTHRSFIIEGTRPLGLEDITKPLGDKYLIGKEPQIEGAPKIEYVSPEEARLTFEISKDRIKLQELQNKEDTSPMDYFNLRKRIDDNVAKLAEIRKSNQPSVNFNERLDDRLLELGWKPEQIDLMSETEKLTKVINGEKPTPPDALDKMWGIEPEKPIEPLPEKGGGVGVLEKTKAEPKTEPSIPKEETVTEVKPEVKTTEKVEAPVKTEEKPETAKPSVTTPTETPFVVPGIKAGEGFWVLTWEEGKFGWVWYQPKDVPAGFVIDTTEPAMTEAEQIRLQQELARMTPEQAARFLERDLPQKGIVVLSNRFPSINLQPAKAPSPLPVQEPVKVPEATPLPTPTAVATPTPTPTPQPLPEPTPTPTPVPSPEPIPVKVPVKPILKPPTTVPPTVIRLPKKEEEKQRIISSPPEGTIILIQGRPQFKGETYAPMYKVVPPPYEDMFTTRQTPKGYIDEGYTGEGSAFKSIQIIGGKLTKDVENLDLGIFRVNMKMVNGKPEVTYAQDVDSNVGSRSMTVGMGKNQIPIEEWETAKAQGIPFDEFIRTYQGHREGEAHIGLYTSPQQEGLDKVELVEYRTPQTKVFLVNGNFVRDNIYQDYTQAGHWKVYPEFIPKDEVWIDRALDTVEDRKSTLVHELVEMEAMGDDRGLNNTYSDVHNNIANPAEAKVRANPDTLDSTINELLGKYKEDGRLPPPEEQGISTKSIPKKRIISKKGKNSDRAIIV